MPTSEADTESLIGRARAGDESAVQALLDRHRERLGQMVAVRMDPRMRGRVDPSDVIQETLMAANQRMEHYFREQPLPFYPWLRQIAWEKLVHLHDRHLRAAKRSVARREQYFRPEISDDSAMALAERFVSPSASPSGAAIHRELRDRVRQALDAMPESDREILLLARYLEQLPSKEIAAIMDLSEAAVNMRHMRSLERMRKILTRESRDA